MANIAFKYRLKPNAVQENYFCRTFGCVRFIYNKMLGDRIAYYREHRKSLHNTPAQYKEMYPFLREVDSLALANAQMHLNAAYKNFFAQPKSGFPKFKSRKNPWQSYSTNNQNGSVRIEGGKIKLPKIGFVKFIQHRPIPDGYKIKTVTITRCPSGKYYISVLAEFENQVSPKKPVKFVGLDFAMHGLYAASDGTKANAPTFFRDKEKQLAKAQRKLSHAKKGSNNRKKLKLKVARIHEKIANQRKDFLQKKSTILANQYDAVCIESLNIKAMAKHHKKGPHYGKSAADNGWSAFVAMLSYKLAWQGKHLVKIDKWYPSSQLCHVCGYRYKRTKDLSIREWVCPQCHTYHDRDINAAINIREEGKRILLS